MNSFSEKYVSACCPHLLASEVSAVYGHIHDTFKSLDLVQPADVRTIARQLFPHVQEQSKDGIVADLSPKSMALLNKFRMEEAISDLKAAKFWLSKVSDPSDTVGMAIRDIGVIADQLQGVKQ